MQLPNNSVPVAAGAAIGAVLISIISLANGWVIAASKVDSQVEELTVSIQASVCAARVEEFLKQGNDTSNMEGYQAAAREKREELARTYSTPMLGSDSPDASVVNACARMINVSRS